ncbi:MAG: ATP-binding protein [Rhodospirillaceae bacterium]|nr:ATP-binding protein [Rhodospirillaceae bacterium]
MFRPSKIVVGLLNGRPLSTLLVVLLYPLMWVLAFKAAVALNVAPGVSAWFPPAGLTFAFLLRFPKAWPLAYFGVGYVVWAAPYATGIVSIVLSILISPTVYIAGTVLLRRIVKGEFDFSRQTHIAGFIIVSLLISAVAGFGNVLNFCIDGIIPWTDGSAMAVRFFIGDSLGIVAIAPTLLLLDRPWLPYFRRYPGWTLWLGLAATAAILYLEVAEIILGHDQGGLSYFVLLPIAWNTVAFGALGAALSSLLVNVSVAVASIIDGDHPVLAGAPYFMLSIAYFSLLVAGMVENLQAIQRRVRQQEARLNKAYHHFATVETAAKLAHEVRQPLASASVYVQSLRDSLQRNALNEKDLADVTRRIDRELKRLREIIALNQEQIGSAGTECEIFRFAHALADVAPLLRQISLDHGVHIDIDVERCAALVSGNRTALQQLAVNLVRNACEAMDAGDAGRRALTVEAFDEDAKAILRVTDTGKGFSEEVLEKGHALFHSSKPSGSGFGLPIARAILEKHEGGLDIANTEDGARVTCWLPCAIGGKDER